jgi:hypothetical protein
MNRKVWQSVCVFMCMFYRSCLSFFFWPSVLSVLLRYTDSDYRRFFFFINNQCHNISTCRSIMEAICDPCSEKNKRLVAEKYCSDCEEKLCTECAEWHMRCMEYPLKQSLKVKQTHKIYDYPRDKLYSIQHHVDNRNNQSGRLCVFHSSRTRIPKRPWL